MVFCKTNSQPSHFIPTKSSWFHITHLPQHFLNRLLLIKITNQSQSPPLRFPVSTPILSPFRIDLTPSDQTDQAPTACGMVRIRISRPELWRSCREARAGVLGIVRSMGSPIHIFANELATLLERFWFLFGLFLLERGVEAGKYQGGGLWKFELGVGFAGRQSEIVL